MSAMPSCVNRPGLVIQKSAEAEVRCFLTSPNPTWLYRHVNLGFFALGVCLGGALLGCHAAPLTYSAADLQSPRSRAKAAPLYWRCNNVPDIRQLERRRVAILDFSVEFITGKVEMPGQTQPTFSPPAIAPAHVGVEYSGLFRKQYEFDEQLYREATDGIYRIFIDALAERGFEVLPNDLVRESSAYKRLAVQDREAGSLLQEMNIIGSDTGRIKQMVTIPASGLRIVVRAAAGDIEEVELAMLDELDVDLSLRAHIRVGVYQDRASIDRGSVIWLLTRDAVGNLTADKSLLSDDVVATPGEFIPLQGRLFNIDSEGFLAAMRKMFPPYIAMAFETAGG